MKGTSRSGIATSVQMKIASLGLAGGRSYDRTNSLRTPTMKVNFFAKKPLPRSFFQHVQTLCMPSVIDLHTHATPGHVTSFVCSRNTSDRWHDRATGEDLRARSIAIEVKHETLPANRKPHAVACCTSTAMPVDLLACTRRRHCSLTRDSHQPVMTGHNARRPRTGRERRP